MKIWLAGVLLFSTLLACGMSGPAGAANAVESSITLQTETERANLRSQKRIDEIADQTSELLQAYRDTTRELESLRAYNAQLERMVASQQLSLESLQIQLNDVQITQREILPLLTRMVDTLAQFIELDKPFLIAERRGRVEALRALLDRADASVAEKYRRVLEAYQIETDYGRSVEAYRGILQTQDSERMVDFLRVGRIALFYRSLDGTDAGTWDPGSRSWQGLSGDYRGALKQAFAVARKQSAPELLILPLSAPTVTQ